MNNFDQALEDSLQKMASGAASANECLAQYPEYSAELKPLLQTAGHFEIGREVVPSEAYKERARGQLMAYIKDHPHRRNRFNFPTIWNIAIALAVLVIAFLVTGTVFAQGALPGQPLYEWKLSTEQAWRAGSPDRVGVDLELADRRASELTSVSGNADDEARALSGYQDVLTRLNSESDAKNNDRIMTTLKSNQQKLSAAGIKIPALDSHLSP
jgi:hypothetical protein